MPTMPIQRHVGMRKLFILLVPILVERDSRFLRGLAQLHQSFTFRQGDGLSSWKTSFGEKMR
jgi:hypothetical protein